MATAQIEKEKQPKMPAALPAKLLSKLNPPHYSPWPFGFLWMSCVPTYKCRQKKTRRCQCLCLYLCRGSWNNIIYLSGRPRQLNHRKQLSVIIIVAECFAVCFIFFSVFFSFSLYVLEYSFLFGVSGDVVGGKSNRFFIFPYPVCSCLCESTHVTHCTLDDDTIQASALRALFGVKNICHIHSVKPIAI